MFRSGIIVALITMLSRIFGLIRELVIAYSFGSSATGDAVNVAFKFPNLFRRIFGEGALSAAFVPYFNEKLNQSNIQARNYASSIFSYLLIILIIICLLMQLFMPYIMLLIAPGFSENIDKFHLSVTLCQITTPYLIFVSCSALLGGMLNSINKFAAYAFSPIILNICVIIFAGIDNDIISKDFSIAYSLIVAGILQLIFMLYYLKKYNLMIALKFFNYNETKEDKQEVKNLLKKMGPAALSSGAQQLNLFISQSIASFIPGAVSILSYADRLYQLPLAIIGISFGTILLPTLSRIYKSADYAKANLVQNQATLIALVISLPAAAGLYFLAKPIIFIIYEHGNFNSSDTILVSDALKTFALGLPAFILSKILLSVFYARSNTMDPLKITLITIVTNIVLSLGLIKHLGLSSIAFASSFSAWLNVYILYFYLKKQNNFTLSASFTKDLLKILLSLILMIIFIELSQSYLFHYIYLDTMLINIASLTFIIIFSIFIYFLTCYIFNVADCRQLINYKLYK